MLEHRIYDVSEKKDVAFTSSDTGVTLQRQFSECGIRLASAGWAQRGERAPEEEGGSANGEPRLRNKRTVQG